MMAQENQAESGQSRNGNGRASKATLVVAVVMVIVLTVVVIVFAIFHGKYQAECFDDEAADVEETAEKTLERDGPWLNVRLPKSLVPYHYEVDLRPVLTASNNGSYWFYGNSTVYFTVNEPTDIILIHSSRLKCDDIQVKDQQGRSVAIKNSSFYGANDFLIIELEQQMVEKKNYSLSITSFHGELADDLVGLYRSTYFNSFNRKKTIAATQMQSAYARKAFPCFDEPALKATFDIALWHKHPNFALSNMPVERTEAIGEWNRTKFERTPRMSTYLLAFVVSEFSFLETFTTGSPKIQTRIYARPEQASGGALEYARNITPRILDYYAEFFGVPYPLPKSDQIALPDFGLGGMENWGLVAYHEVVMLYEPTVSSSSDKYGVASVIAHELAHQWFGNLISPLWWDELWLNEGFARFVQYLGIESIEPSFRASDKFIIRETHRAMGVDGLLSSRPIVAENVETVDEINALFDSISYAKGACIIRMIKTFVGDQAFRLGLKNYLEEYTYGSVVHQELFKFWEKAVNESKTASYPPGGFENAMNTWVLQMGFPTINVKRRSSSSEQVVVSQERFLLDPDANITQPENELGYQWVVPFWYMEDAGKKQFWLLPNSPRAIEVPVGKYIIGNYEVFGYYRVNYDEEMWKLIINQLVNDFQVINVKSRGQLIDDAFNLARARKLSYEIALNLTMFLRSDHDYIPWKCAIDVFTYLTEMLGRSKVYGMFSSYLLRLAEPAYQSLLWKNEPTTRPLEKLQRKNIIRLACSNGNKNCTSMVTTMFQNWRANPLRNNIDVDLRDEVYCQAIAHGGSREWDFAWMKYKSEQNIHEKSRLMKALTCTKSSWLIQRFLTSMRNGTHVRKQDGSVVLINLCNNEFARDITWDFIRAKWSYIHKVYGSALFAFRKIIQSCTSTFSTDFELQELENFTKNNVNNLGSSLRPFKQAIEQTKANIQWRSDNQDVILNWLKTAIIRH